MKTNSRQQEHTQQGAGLLLMVTISHSVLVFLRYNLGYRLLQPSIFFRVFVALSIIGYLIGRSESEQGLPTRQGTSLIAFVLLMAFFASCQRMNAKKAALNPHAPLHTLSRGNSYLSRILRFVRIKERPIQRHIEPLLVAGIGAYLGFVLPFPVLGIWLIVAGICLAQVEWIVDRQWTERMLDAQDEYADGQAMRESVPVMNGGQISDRRSNIMGESAVTTSPELAKLQASKKRK